MSRVGWFLLRHTTLLRRVHPLFHRSDDECADTCLVCRCAFAALLGDPEFMADIERGERA